MASGFATRCRLGGRSTNDFRGRVVTRSFKVYCAKVLPVGGDTMGPSAQTYLNDPAGRLRIVLEHKQSADAYVRR